MLYLLVIENSTWKIKSLFKVGRLKENLVFNAFLIEPKVASNRADFLQGPSSMGVEEPRWSDVTS